MLSKSAVQDLNESLRPSVPPVPIDANKLFELFRTSPTCLNWLNIHVIHVIENAIENGELDVDVTL